MPDLITVCRATQLTPVAYRFYGGFSEVRATAKRLHHDPSPLVRAKARHVEEDARELAALEALRDWTAEREEGARAIAHRPEWRGTLGQC